MQKNKILILSEKPLDDYNVWSGTVYNINQALIKQGYETEWLPTPKFSSKEQRLFEKIEKLYTKIFNRGFNRMHFLTKAYLAAKHLKKEIKTRDFDILFAPAAAGFIPFLKIKQPIIYLNDANAAQLFNYNVMFTGFGYLSKEITKYLEKKTMNNAKAVIFSNEWGVNFAKNNYNINPKKVFLARFGANLPIPENVKSFSDKGTSPLKLLFIAGRWELKGGDIAYEAYKILKEKGYNIEFTIVGCNPQIEDDNDANLKIINSIDKNTPEGLSKIIDLFNNSNIFILPTRNDCSPIVTCEASAFGIPTITTITGGVHEIILDDFNGYTLPLSAKAEEYANKIEYLINNPNELNRLSTNAKKRYEDVLNWNTWGSEVKKIIENI